MNKQFLFLYSLIRIVIFFIINCIVVNFSKNYNKIDYSYENINEYCNHVYHQQLEIENEFTLHIIFEYIFKRMMFIEIIIKYDNFLSKILEIVNSFDMLNNIFNYYSSCFKKVSRYPRILNDENIIYLLKYIDKSYFVSLDASEQDITDKSLKYLTSLTQLDTNEYVTDNSVILLTNLTCLNLQNCENITDKSIKELTYLKYLNIAQNGHIDVTDESISRLTNLVYLNIGHNYSYDNITDKSIRKLNKLKYLIATRNEMNITDSSVKNLTELIYLDLRENEMISIDHLKNLIYIAFDDDNYDQDYLMELLKNSHKLKYLVLNVNECNYEIINEYKKYCNVYLCNENKEEIKQDGLTEEIEKKIITDLLVDNI